MAIPDYQSLMLPVLKLIDSGHQTVSEMATPIAMQFNLTEDERNQLLPSGKQLVISNRLHWARHYLYQAGLVEPIKRGHYKISHTGKKVLANSPGKIDNQFLMQFEAFASFKNGGALSSSPLPENTARENSGNTPEEEIEIAMQSLNAALAEELLDAVLQVSPGRFEALVVELLVKMGYGGGALEAGHQTKISGDGGIDGVINEDPLGLDAVYVQAKRYAKENHVQRPALNAFVGSLHGENATKGVFVTTSDFTSGARSYVEKVSQRIVLINGAQLAALMIKHEVGVRTRKTYRVRSLDEDFFTEA